MYPRKLTGLMRELLGQFRIVYLTGPRQAGNNLGKVVGPAIGDGILDPGSASLVGVRAP